MDAEVGGLPLLTCNAGHGGPYVRRSMEMLLLGFTDTLRSRKVEGAPGCGGSVCRARTAAADRGSDVVELQRGWMLG